MTHLKLIRKLNRKNSIKTVIIIILALVSLISIGKYAKLRKKHNSFLRQHVDHAREHYIDGYEKGVQDTFEFYNLGDKLESEAI